ncbi:MAG: hypothetical protein ACOH2T_19100 [Pseudomonas sp.]
MSRQLAQAIAESIDYMTPPNPMYGRPSKRFKRSRVNWISLEGYAAIAVTFLVLLRIFS